MEGVLSKGQRCGLLSDYELFLFVFSGTLYTNHAMDM